MEEVRKVAILKMIRVYRQILLSGEFGSPLESYIESRVQLLIEEATKPLQK